MTAPTLNDFRVRHRLRVRWAEIDLQRIVFNPHYLMYVDTAFTDYWRALAIPYEAIPATLGGDLYVKKSTLEVHGSARLDDVLQVGIRCQRIGNSSMQFVAGIFRDAELLVSSELVYVFADPTTQTSRPLPQILRDVFTDFEAGQAMHDCVIGNWATLAPQARALRQEFLVQDLGISGLDEDASDPHCEHLVLRNRLGHAVATGRLSRESPGCARISRMAVLRPMRSGGWGRCAVEALARHARERGDTRLLLSAHTAVVPFYVKLGFVATGQPYDEAGLMHVDMARNA